MLREGPKLIFLDQGHSDRRGEAKGTEARNDGTCTFPEEKDDWEETF